jgi:NAD(P)-dependent dehydrogenase (short-subunit alcohol dehydrogenase family)
MLRRQARKSSKPSAPPLLAKQVRPAPIVPNLTSLFTNPNLVPPYFDFICQQSTVLITGPSQSGLGAQTALSLAPGKPDQLILAGRTLSKIAPVIAEIQIISPSIKVTFVELDLSDLSSVRKAALLISEKIEKLDILINNAGIMAVKEYGESKEGIEMQFAANHIGHFLLTNLLMEKIFAAEEARIVNVSSGGYVCSGVRFEDWNFEV